MPKTNNYDLLMDWDGPRVSDLITEYCDKNEDSINDAYESVNKECLGIYEREFNMARYISNLHRRKIPVELAEYALHKIYGQGLVEWAITEEQIKKSDKPESILAKIIDGMCEEWLNDPDKFYYKILEELY